MGTNDGAYSKIGAIATVVGTVIAIIAIFVGNNGGGTGGGVTSPPVNTRPGRAPDPTNTTSAPNPGPAPSTDTPTSAHGAHQTYYLADLHHVEGINPWSRGTISINGKQFAHGISQLGSASKPTSTQFDLKRQCDEFEFTAGITDDSSTMSVGRFEVFGDNQLLKSFQLGYGRDVHYTINVKDVLRLKVQNTIIQNTNAYYRAGWGDAAIRCSGTLWTLRSNVGGG